MNYQQKKSEKNDKTILLKVETIDNVQFRQVFLSSEVNNWNK